MGPNPDKETTVSEKVADPKFRAKIEQRNREKFIPCCPRCFSIRIRPLVSIAGIISHEEWQCERCGYVGISIEVHVDDLEKIHQEQRERDEKKWKERFLTNIKAPLKSEPS